MSRSLVLNVLPFGLVVALAAALGIAGVLAAPHPDSSSSPSRSTARSPEAAVASVGPQPTSAARSEAAEMLRVHNELRLPIGALPVRADQRVTAAAQQHAEYLAQNNAIGHEESPGSRGFTGATVRDRLAAQGYADATASEVAASGGSGTDAVRSLWMLPYHRLGLMHPHAVVAGWGHAEIDGRSTTVGVIVYDFASPSPDVVRAPAAGQRVPASWDGEESPGVLPSGSTRPVGYPLMLVASRAAVVELRSARLTDAAGRETAYHVVPQIYERDYVAVVPLAPLASGARYTIRFELRISGVDATEEWTFATEP